MCRRGYSGLEPCVGPMGTSMPQSQVRWTAYGAQAQGELREVITEAKRTDPLAPLTVVVPSDLAGVVTLRFLASGVTEGSPRRRGIAGLQILTVDRLAEQLATAALVGTGRGPRPASCTASCAAAPTRSARELCTLFSVSYT